MAQQVHTELVDDIDGSPAKQTVMFAVQGRSYEIDLNEQHAAEFFADLARWTRHARRTGVSFGTHRRPARRDPAQTRAIRAWAQSNGFDVKPTGRIPPEVEAAFHATTQAG